MLLAPRPPSRIYDELQPTIPHVLGHGRHMGFVYVEYDIGYGKSIALLSLLTGRPRNCVMKAVRSSDFEMKLEAFQNKAW